jgi:hypothetical protein
MLLFLPDADSEILVTSSFCNSLMIVTLARRFLQQEITSVELRDFLHAAWDLRRVTACRASEVLLCLLRT